MKPGSTASTGGTATTGSVPGPPPSPPSPASDRVGIVVVIDGDVTCALPTYATRTDTSVSASSAGRSTAKVPSARTLAVHWSSPRDTSANNRRPVGVLSIAPCRVKPVAVSSTSPTVGAFARGRITWNDVAATRWPSRQATASNGPAGTDDRSSGADTSPVDDGSRTSRRVVPDARSTTVKRSNAGPVAVRSGRSSAVEKSDRPSTVPDAGPPTEVTVSGRCAPSSRSGRETRVDTDPTAPS